MNYWLIFLGTMALSLFAMMLVRYTYAKYSQVPASSGYTGAQVAQRILDLNHITDVSVEATPGTLSDHYDPERKALMLSEANFYGRSVAALGIAAHECGHAVQHQQGYAPLQWRMAAIGLTSFASKMVYWISLASMFGYFLHMQFPYRSMVAILAAAFGIIMVFQLITLPVEFDATARAKRTVVRMGAVAAGAEYQGMSRVLDAAALTYVAALISALGQFLYYLWRMQSNR